MECGWGEGGDGVEELVGPDQCVARGAPVAEGLRDERVPGRVEIGVAPGK